MKKLYLISLLLFSPFLFAAAQEDTQFWFVCPDVSQSPGLNLDRPIHLYMTAFASPATVTISQPAGGGFPTAVITIPANSTTSFDMTPWLTSLENTPPNTVLNTGILIQSTAPITACYYVVGGPSCLCNPEDFILKGSNAVGTDFWIPGQDTIDNDPGYTPTPTNAFDIVATQNGTTVTITPYNNIVGHAALTTFTVTLNQGQAYSATATSTLGINHLRGSHVTSDKPVAIMEKDDLLGFLSTTTGVYGADLIGDQIVPVNVLGTEYIPMYGNLSAPGDKLFITATQNLTTISLNGTYLTTINAGQTYRMNCPNPSGYLQTSFPAYVYQLSGINSEVGSALLPQINCTGSSAVSLYQSSTIDFKLNLLVKAAGIGNFLVNGVAGAILATSFVPVPGTAGAWYSAQVVMPVATYPTGSVLNVTNTTSLFQLGFLSSGPVNSGASFGYYSNYGGINPNPTTPDPSLCAGDSILLFSDTISTATYSWTGPGGFTSTLQNPFITPSLVADSGLYRVIVTTPGCMDSGNVTIAVHPYPSVGLGNDTIVCNNTMITLQNLDPAYSTDTYLWSTAATTSSITVSASGIYWLAVSNAGCVKTDTINVTEKPVISPDFIPVIHRGCTSDLVDFTNILPNATTYTWNFGDGSPLDNSYLTTSHTYSVQGVYNIVLTGYDPPCTGDTTITINTLHPIVADFSPAPDTFCAGGTANFTDLSTPATALVSYLWQLGDGTTDTTVGSISHIYNNAMIFPVTLVVTDTLGCKSTKTKNVFALSLAIEAHDTTICYTQPLQLNNMVNLTPPINLSNYSYTWMPETGLNDTSVQQPYFSGLGTYIYVYSVTINPFGCTASDTVRINSLAGQPVTNITPDQTIPYGSGIQLNCDNEVYYWWQPDNGSLSNANINDPVAMPAATTVYTVYGYDPNGCLDSASVTINVDSSMTECIPTAFTPNGDGLNDIFRATCIKFQNIVDFRIYNRWGQQVFYSNSYKNGWDGTFNGTPQDMGTYFYVITVARPGAADLIYKGDVTLIR